MLIVPYDHRCCEDEMVLVDVEGDGRSWWVCVWCDRIERVIAGNVVPFDASLWV